MSLGAGGLANRVRFDWHRRDPWAVRAVVAAIVVGVVLASLAIGDRIGRPDAAGAAGRRADAAARGGGAPPPPATGTSEGSIPGVDVHVDERAGYLVSFPSDWQLDEHRGADELVDPTGSSVLGFDAAPPGPLATAAEAAIATIAPSDANVAIVTRRAERTEQGQQGLVVGATATDASGTSVQLMAVAIRGSTRNYAITARFPSTVTRAFLDDLEQIVGSFRTTG